MTQLLNYDLIQAFNEDFYKELLFPANICGDEIFVAKAKDRDGVEIPDLDMFFVPLKKDNTNYLLPAEFANKLPIKIVSAEKMSVDKKAYTVIDNCTPAGFGAARTFDSVREFVDQFCDYEHSEPKNFTLWKLVSLVAYLKRINVRVASAPAFGKDSILRVLNSLVGDVGIVHNPTTAKVEYLLTNKILMTNEVAGIKNEDVENLAQYYLTCGDFSNVYEKRAVANYKGSMNTYNIKKLSNVICFNDIDCYPKKKREKYFDNLFQKAILERFFPLRFDGKITEVFGNILHTHKLVEENAAFYKNNIKMLKYLEKHFEEEIHGYEPMVHPFTDRLARVWETICLMIDLYCKDQEEYNEYCKLLMEKYNDYFNMLNGVKKEPEFEKAKFTKDESQMSLNSIEEEIM